MVVIVKNEFLFLSSHQPSLQPSPVLLAPSAGLCLHPHRLPALVKYSPPEIYSCGGNKTESKSVLLVAGERTGGWQSRTRLSGSRKRCYRTSLPPTTWRAGSPETIMTRKTWRRRPACALSRPSRVSAAATGGRGC